jgi:hypothetical protein
MSWFDRFFHFHRPNGLDQPKVDVESSHYELPKQSVVLVGSHSEIDDPMYTQAIIFVLGSGRASINAVQRHLKIGYNRAARFIETMESDGIVSSLGANGARRVLSTVERSAYLLDCNTEAVHKPRDPEPLTCVERMVLPPLTGKIRGTKDKGFNIVGESHFQAALRQIRNSRCLDMDNDFEAFIVTEPANLHDANACAVFIDGLKVGYLPREAAASFVDQIAKEGIFGVSCFQLRAKLVGGYGAKLKIGVMVNLPSSND